jgi:hypothetical protein
MGTSKDYGGGKGGAWTTTKRIATQISHDGPDADRIRRYAEAYVEALGGPAQAAQNSIAATRTTAAIGGFFNDVRDKGLGQALTDLGLAEAIGKPAMELIEMLADKLAGEGATLDENAAREALIDLLDLEWGDLTYAEIEAQTLGDDQIREGLATYLARFVFRKVLPLIESKLNKATPDIRRRTEEDLAGYAAAKCQDVVRGIDLRGFNPMQDGLALAQSVVQRAYELFGS